jgi:hypothetical protein
MSLRAQAERDLATIVEDEDGFGWPITVTNPDGSSAALVGLSNDVAYALDPETGQAVSGRTASVALRIGALTAAGLGIPVNVSETTRFPWIVQFNDINGNPHVFKVIESQPDRAIGLVVCKLEAYQA